MLEEIQNRVWDNLEQVISSPSTEVSISVTTSPSPCAGHQIKVDVDYPTFPITMPFLGTILGSQQIPIHATIKDTIITPRCP